MLPDHGHACITDRARPTVRVCSPSTVSHSVTATCHLGAWAGGGWVQARRKYQEVLAEKQQLQMDNEELQSKYNQKVM